MVPSGHIPVTPSMKTLPSTCTHSHGGSEVVLAGEWFNQPVPAGTSEVDRACRHENEPVVWKFLPEALIMKL